MLPKPKKQTLSSRSQQATTPPMPPTSPLAEFRFATIGQEPNLLKRLSDPLPDAIYRTPSPSSSMSVSTETPRAELAAPPLSRPTLLEALTGIESATLKMSSGPHATAQPSDQPSRIGKGATANSQLEAGDIFRHASAAFAPITNAKPALSTTPTGANTNATMSGPSDAVHSAEHSGPGTYSSPSTSTAAPVAPPAQEPHFAHSSSSPDLYTLVSQLAQERTAWDDIRTLRTKYREELQELLRRNDETIRAAQREKDQAMRVVTTAENMLDRMESLRARQEQRWAAEQARTEEVAAEARRLLEEKQQAETQRMLEEKRRAAEEAAAEAQRQAAVAAAEAQERMRVQAEQKRKAAEEEARRRAAEEEAQRRAAAEEEKRKAAAEAEAQAEAKKLEEARKQKEAEETRRREEDEQRRKEAERQQELRRAQVQAEKAQKMEENAARARREALQAKLDKEKNQIQSRSANVSPTITSASPLTAPAVLSALPDLPVKAQAQKPAESSQPLPPAAPSPTAGVQAAAPSQATPAVYALLPPRPDFAVKASQPEPSRKEPCSTAADTYSKPSTLPSSKSSQNADAGSTLREETRRISSVKTEQVTAAFPEKRKNAKRDSDKQTAAPVVVKRERGHSLDYEDPAQFHSTPGRPPTPQPTSQRDRQGQPAPPESRPITQPQPSRSTKNRTRSERQSGGNSKTASVVASPVVSTSSQLASIGKTASHKPVSNQASLPSTHIPSVHLPSSTALGQGYHDHDDGWDNGDAHGWNDGGWSIPAPSQPSTDHPDPWVNAPRSSPGDELLPDGGRRSPKRSSIQDDATHPPIAREDRHASGPSKRMDHWSPTPDPAGFRETRSGRKRARDVDRWDPDEEPPNARRRYSWDDAGDELLYPQDAYLPRSGRSREPSPAYAPYPEQFLGERNYYPALAASTYELAPEVPFYDPYVDAPAYAAPAQPTRGAAPSRRARNRYPAATQPEYRRPAVTNGKQSNALRKRTANEAAEYHAPERRLSPQEAGSSLLNRMSDAPRYNSGNAQGSRASPPSPPRQQRTANRGRGGGTRGGGKVLRDRIAPSNEGRLLEDRIER